MILTATGIAREAVAEAPNVIVISHEAEAPNVIATGRVNVNVIERGTETEIVITTIVLETEIESATKRETCCMLSAVTRTRPRSTTATTTSLARKTSTQATPALVAPTP